MAETDGASHDGFEAQDEAHEPDEGELPEQSESSDYDVAAPSKFVTSSWPLRDSAWQSLVRNLSPSVEVRALGMPAMQAALNSARFTTSWPTAHTTSLLSTFELSQPWKEALAPLAKSIQVPTVWQSLDTPKFTNQFFSDANVKNLSQPWKEALAPLAKSIQVPSVWQSIYVPNIAGQFVSNALVESLRMTTVALLSNLRLSLPQFADSETFNRLNKSFLPENLRSFSDRITPGEVYEFLENEALPLYLVPRGDVALRFLKAKDTPSRRRILNDRFDAIVKDCERVIEHATDPWVSTEAHFLLDGIGAVGSGHYASAQAIFTLVLDTLISKFYPGEEGKQERRAITNRKPQEEAPRAITKMHLHESMVWLPIWNAHAQFWEHKNDVVPFPYSRHSTVHAVSKRQYSKRNSAQALLLATSLLGYAQKVAQRRVAAA